MLITLSERLGLSPFFYCSVFFNFSFLSLSTLIIIYLIFFPLGGGAGLVFVFIY